LLVDDLILPAKYRAHTGSRASREKKRWGGPRFGEFPRPHCTVRIMSGGQWTVGVAVFSVRPKVTLVARLGSKGARPVR
jgi:hypothetical protein